MTDRQFVKQYYPRAVLDFRVMPRNTMSPKTWYEIRTKEWGTGGEILSNGFTREIAWRNAKKRIQNQLTVKK